MTLKDAVKIGLISKEIVDIFAKNDLSLTEALTVVFVVGESYQREIEYVKQKGLDPNEIRPSNKAEVTVN